MNHVARWDGSSWSLLGNGFDDSVYAIALGEGDILYAGGAFTTADSASNNCIAKWDGSSWSALGTGIHQELFGSSYVNDLAAIGGALYVGGRFDRVGGIYANNVAKWDGIEWSALGSGISLGGYPYISTLAVIGNDLYVGGSFWSAGGVAANNVAKWNGSSWSALGSGVYGSTYHAVRTLAAHGNNLFLGGVFMTAGSKPSVNIAIWQPRVNVSTLQYTADPGATTLGNDVFAFYKPALITNTGATISYGGSLPVTVKMDGANEIHVMGKRVNGAFSINPSGVSFSPAATLRIEFSEDDVAAYGGTCTYRDFRAVKLTYPNDYPANKEAKREYLSNNVPVAVRKENGRQIYAVEVPITEISSTYGAAPASYVTTSVPAALWVSY